MKKQQKVKWLEQPEQKDYAAAEEYLSLLYAPKSAARWARRLARAGMSRFAAKDILRASNISILEIQAFDWSRQRKKVEQGAALSPILLLRLENSGRLVVADGFHRLCTVFTTDQEIEVPCKLIGVAR